MRRKLVSFFLIACILCVMPMTAFALGFDAGRTGTISVTLAEHSSKTPIRGAEFALYRVASAAPDKKGDLSYTYTDAFQDFDTLPDDPAVVAELEAYIGRHGVAAEKAVTDAQGRTVFSNLPLGLYFLKQTNYVDGYAVCKPFLVSVPDQTDSGYIYDIKATPKTEPAKFTDITVRKVWDVDNAAKIADHVTVELLRDGVAVKTAVLNEGNNWAVTYSDMPESDAYSIVELDIPAGFTAAYTRRGYEFTVTNKLSPNPGNPGSPSGPSDPGIPGGPVDPGNPGNPGDPVIPGDPDAPGGSGGSGDVPSMEGGEDDSALIQTGQLIWPIPVLAMAGLCLIAVGAIVLRKTRDEHA